MLLAALLATALAADPGPCPSGAAGVRSVSALVFPSDALPCAPGAGPLRVEGDLVVTAAAKSLAGLECVCGIGGDVDLTRNALLVSFDGLSLEAMEGALKVPAHHLLPVDQLPERTVVTVPVRQPPGSQRREPPVPARPAESNESEVPLVAWLRENFDWRLVSAGVLLLAVPGGLMVWFLLRALVVVAEEKAPPAERPKGLGKEHYEHLDFTRSAPGDPDVPACVRDLDTTDLAALKQALVHADLGYGDVQAEVGDPDPAAVWVLEGQLTATLDGEDVFDVGPGGCLGGIGLYEDSPRTLGAISRASARIALIERPAWDRLGHQAHPALPRLERAMLLSRLGALDHLRRELASIQAGSARGQRDLAPANEIRQRVQAWLRTVELERAGASIDLSHLDGCPAFEGVPRRWREALVEGASIRELGAGAPLFLQGRPGALFVVGSGRVELATALAEPFEPLVVDRVGAGDLVGLEALTGAALTATAVCRSPVRVLELPTAAVSRALSATDPASRAVRVALIRAAEASLRWTVAALRGEDPGIDHGEHYRRPR